MHDNEFIALQHALRGIACVVLKHRETDSLKGAAKELFALLSIRKDHFDPDAAQEPIPTDPLKAFRYPRSGYLYLQPIEKGKPLLPLLHLVYEGIDKKNIFTCRVYLQLYCLNQGAAADPENYEVLVNDPVRAIGLRYELAEGGDYLGGIHDFGHAQFVTKMENEKLPGMDWFPDSQPAFPLDCDATNPAGLLACLVLSLYGPEGAAKLQSAFHGCPSAPKIRALVEQAKSTGKSKSQARTVAAEKKTGKGATKKR